MVRQGGTDEFRAVVKKAIGRAAGTSRVHRVGLGISKIGSVGKDPSSGKRACPKRAARKLVRSPKRKRA
jgi:hypothetical protein